MLAWTIYLTLGVLCLSFGWAWLAPRLPRRVRLVVLGLFAGLAVVSLAVAAQVPHDYQALDFVEYGHGVAALGAQLLLAIAALSAALAAVGRRGTQYPLLIAMIGVGVYVSGTGGALYLLLGGQSTLHAPVLLILGTAMTVAAATRVAGGKRRESCVFGLGIGVLVAVVAEALRGMGGRGSGPETASPFSLLLLAVVAALLVGGGYMLRRQARSLVGPLGLAALGVAITALVLGLRGQGEWAPGPHSSSTTLYGLPLTLLVVCISLILLDLPAGSSDPQPEGLSRRIGTRRVRSDWPLPLVAGLLLVLVLTTAWHPAPDPCINTPYSDSSPLNPGKAAWALSPSAAAKRGSPDVAAFDRACPQHAQAIGQLVYAFFPVCKWAQVDPDYPLVQASGTLDHTELSAADSPWLHTSHDLGLDIVPDPASAWLALNNGPPGTLRGAGSPGSAGPLLHAEVESARFPDDYRPVAGDRVTVAGRWIYDCGHDPKTEIHPAAVVATEHDEWREVAEGGPKQVHVLQVWMNSSPGVVHVPLSTFAMSVSFPALPAGQTATPLVSIASGNSSDMRWTIHPESSSGQAPRADVQFAAPSSGGSAYFELLFGYQEPIPSPSALAAYTVAFDSLIVANNLKSAAGNITGVLDLGYPQLGFAGSGHWFMDAIVGRTWRTLLTNGAVEKGHSYSLVSVPPVRILASGGERLSLSVFGFAENDPATGVELASGVVDGAPIVRWDAGSLAGLCCDKKQTFTPANGAWTITYHVSNAAR